MSAAKKQEVATVETHPPVAMTPIERALASGAPPEVWAKMLEVQERWDANQARKAYDAAMAEAQAEMPTIIKDREVDYTSQKGRTHYKHASLATIERAVKPVLAKFGLNYRFSTAVTEQGGLAVTCIIAHRDGHMERNTLPAPLDTSGSKNAIQALGSTQTYLQRYTLMAALGLSAADDDDDIAAGNGASNGQHISADEVANLRARLTAMDMPEEKFLAWARTHRPNINSIEDIPAALYDNCVSSLERTASRKTQS